MPIDTYVSDWGASSLPYTGVSKTVEPAHDVGGGDAPPTSGQLWPRGDDA